MDGANPAQAAKLLENMLHANPPDEVRRTALLELALMTQAQRQFTTAQQILSQYVQMYPRDASVPEVLLRQGLLYREMSAPEMALAKFYAVMTVVLHLKLDRLEYYQRLVLQAQTEIADTNYAQKKFAEAAGCYRRLLKLDAAALNTAQIQAKLIRSLSRQGLHSDVVPEAEDFLRSPADPLLQAEARLLLARALHGLGRTTAARTQLFQHLALLADWQRTATNALPAELARDAQQAGNEVANQFYSAGDYANALELYLSLAQFSSAPEWQLPALYQAALVHERLSQWAKARELYTRILELGRASSAATDDPVKFLLDMAGRRLKMAAWLIQAADGVTAVQPILNRRAEALPGP